MDRCLRIIGDEQATPLDSLLIVQIQCLTISNSLTCPVPDSPFESEPSIHLPISTVRMLQTQLDNIRRNMPAHVGSIRK